MAKIRIGELLVRQGKLSKAQLKQALDLQQMVGGRLGTNLVELGMIDEVPLLAALGEQRATRTVDASDLQRAHPAVVKMLRQKLAERYRIVPFELRGKTLSIASPDPIDPFVEDEIRMLTSCMVRSFLATELRVNQALELYFQVPMEMRFSTLLKRLENSGRRERDTRAEDLGLVVPASAGDGGPSAAPVRPVARPPVPVPAQITEPPAVPPKPPEEPRFIELDAEDMALLASEPAALEAPPADVRHEPRPSESPGAVGTGRQEPAPPVPSPRAPAVPAAEPPIAVEAAPAADESLEDRLAWAARAFQHAEIRDDIADVLLDFCAPFFKRRMLLIRRKGRILGWRAEGSGIDGEQVRTVEIDVHQPSVFLSVTSSGFWLGPLPPLPSNEDLVSALGEIRPQDCVVLPITMLSKIVCYLYGDNLEESVAGAPLAELRRLVAKAAIAFEVYILKNKIRMI